MARPVEFNEHKVLTKAMEQFWKEGYEASSVQKLLDCTEINRGTLYNSFGDKSTFFKSCIDQYNQIVDKQIAASLRNEKLTGWDAIDAYFDETVLKLSNKHRSMGCILVNSLCESINYNRDMKKIVRASLATIRKALVAKLKEAHKKAKLKKGVSVEFAAEILMNTLHGVRVNARDGKNARQLRDLIKFSVVSLKK
ncbi:MAG TPA: TetR/AcrR family transcriptional regulator [Gammaproteobacteria bacterium]|jgi:TetR/AcrR family transcriptional repressor of nem operon|nr:TetR/AcrR family transcriptional regulator [Gammaproteobacteria bacterium]HIL62227.1 TetR/AcrR family transcriptional regulator [Porticoccaceae bacterium]HIN89319.1 TetR/AcrR family transcriptional regulator [Porticoccaceae bacterium]|tara:strand:- start:12398 stop:12985 length:588 start_codon:yes stop_codon:yes gene_type:complete